MISLAALWCWALLALGAGLAGLRSRRPPPSRIQRPARVWLVRPLAGIEPGLRERLTAAPILPGLEHYFTVASPDDPALPIAESVAATLRSRGAAAEVLICPPRGPNPKAGQLAALLALRTAPEELISADSDVWLDHADLEALLTTDTAAAWSPPVEQVTPSSLGDRVSAALFGRSFHAFPFLAAVDPGALVGKLYRVRPGAVEACGGFASLADYLGEDMELGRRLRASGAAIAVSARPARAGVPGKRWSEVIRRQRRWISVIRAQRPWLLLGYPLLFFPTPLFLALAAAAGTASPSAAAATALVFTLGRALPSQAVPPAHRGSWWALPLAELSLLLGFAGALSSRQVRWRGARYRIQGRRLLPYGPTATSGAAPSDPGSPQTTPAAAR
ncbi:MAG: glycosyltransferase [Myxococcota bacterium]